MAKNPVAECDSGKRRDTGRVARHEAFEKIVINKRLHVPG